MWWQCPKICHHTLCDIEITTFCWTQVEVNRNTLSSLKFNQNGTQLFEFWQVSHNDKRQEDQLHGNFVHSHFDPGLFFRPLQSLVCIPTFFCLFDFKIYPRVSLKGPFKNHGQLYWTKKSRVKKKRRSRREKSRSRRKKSRVRREKARTSRPL
jgi:hypothetical protein